jgi:proteasome lid subunit RPN8/RPN11
MSWLRKSRAAPEKAPESSHATKQEVKASAWKRTEPAIRRAFPGPRGASALLRLAMGREAYAELIAHAKESLDKEVCGVLAGEVCEDESGAFVQVNAIVRGTSAAQGSTHVTFTHDTWTQIHRTLENRYPESQIVGWYHSHPGFGVEFSEMDAFIQKNFFSGPTQVALVIDPLSGAVAICLNTEKGIRYIERFWVDGREQPCQAPKAADSAPAGGASSDNDRDSALKALEARVGQLIQALDEQRTSYYRFLLVVGMVVCLGVVGCIGYTIYSNYRYRNEPPRLTQFVPVPVQVGDKSVLLGVGIAEWRVPEELNAAMQELEREKRLLEAAAQTNKAPLTNQPPK